MICERCKIREANIKYTEVINGVKTEHNLCSQCAREMDFGQYSSIFEGDFPFGKLLSGLLGLGENTSSREQEMRQITCPTCGLTYEEFLKKSRFGCADCYQVFDLLITDNIKKVQGSESHKGKIPENEEPLGGLWRGKRGGRRYGGYAEGRVCRDAGGRGRHGEPSDETKAPAGGGRKERGVRDRGPSA